MKTLRVLTFNTYRMGLGIDDGLMKIARQIRNSKAEIVMLQVGGERVRNIIYFIFIIRYNDSMKPH